jgi:hypothetical protein
VETLTRPSGELAARVLGEVGFEDRITGSSLHVRAGVRTLSLYSLEDTFRLLKEPYPYIDLDQLEGWIRTVIKDEELADKVKTVIAQTSNEQDTLVIIRDLVGVRLIQCKQLTGGKG